MEFCFIQNVNKPFILNVINTKKYLKNHGYDIPIDYRIFEYDTYRSKTNVDSKIKRINKYIQGKSVLEMVDLDQVVKLLNNFHRGFDLLHNIDVNPQGLKLIKNIVDYYKLKNVSRLETVCFSIYEAFIFYNIFTILLLKRINPNIKIVVGGVSIISSDRVAEFFAAIEEIDYVISGDVESGILDFVKGKVNKNIVYKPEYVDMNLLHPIIYTKEDFKISNKRCYINGIRGCTQKCGYCINYSLKFRFSNIDDFVKSIALNNDVNKHNFTHYYFTDNTVNFSKRRIHRLLDRLIAIKNDKPIILFYIFKHLDDEIIEKSKKAGVIEIMLGLEGKVQKLFYNKCSIDYSEEIEKIDKMTKIGLHVLLMHVFCSPNETKEAFEYDIKAFDEICNNDNNNLKMLVYGYDQIAGSGLHMNPEKYGITYEYWKPQKLFKENEKLEKIIPTIPKYYYCQLSKEEYDIRHKILADMMNKHMKLKE